MKAPRGEFQEAVDISSAGFATINITAGSADLSFRLLHIMSMQKLTALVLPSDVFTVASLNLIDLPLLTSATGLSSVRGVQILGLQSLLLLNMPFPCNEAFSDAAYSLTVYTTAFTGVVHPSNFSTHAYQVLVVDSPGITEVALPPWTECLATMEIEPPYAPKTPSCTR